MVDAQKNVLIQFFSGLSVVVHEMKISPIFNWKRDENNIFPRNMEKAASNNRGGKKRIEIEAFLLLPRRSRVLI
jgi:hypothetical protein